MYRFLKLVFIFALVILTGCSERAQNTNIEKLVPSKASPQTEIKLTPVDLFKGEGAKFQPFLGSMSGAFKLSYQGKKPNAKLDLDILQNGKVIRYGSIGDLFFSSEGRLNSEIEVIISIETVSIGEQDKYKIIKIGTIREQGSSLGTYTLPWDNSLSSTATISNNESRTFTADEPIHVWGMQATSSNFIHTADFSQESLNKLEWGLIFTLRFEE